MAALTPADKAARSRRRSLALVVVLLVVVNLPFLHGAWIDRSIDRDGVDVTAAVVDSLESGDGGVVEFRFDIDVDPDRRTWTAAVDRATYDRALDDGTLEVRVVPGSPERYRAAGAAGSGTLVALTVFADVVLLIALVLLWRRRPDGGLRLVATEDVQLARPGGRLERITASAYLVVGEVVGIEPAAVVLDVGDRHVRVELGTHHNPIGWQQPAQVRARVPESGA